MAIKVKMETVVSSTVHSIGYNENLRKLVVKFNSGGAYAYDNVPTIVFKEMLEAESPGKYLAEKVKGIYPYKKVL